MDIFCLYVTQPIATIATYGSSQNENHPRHHVSQFLRKFPAPRGQLLHFRSRFLGTFPQVGSHQKLSERKGERCHIQYLDIDIYTNFNLEYRSIETKKRKCTDENKMMKASPEEATKGWRTLGRFIHNFAGFFLDNWHQLFA